VYARVRDHGSNSGVNGVVETVDCGDEAADTWWRLERTDFVGDLPSQAIGRREQMSLPQTDAWIRRASFPAPLGFLGEFWDTDPAHYEAAVALDVRLRSLGQKPTKPELAWKLAAHLLDDLLVAAGGVEISILRFRSAVDRTRAWVAEHNLQAEAGVPTIVADHSTSEAWYAFADLFVWLRTVQERIQRKGNKVKHEQGLLPALKPERLKKQVELTFGSFRANPAIQSARRLADCTLHGFLVLHPDSGARLRPDGTLHLPVPDPPTARVAHWDLFIWQHDRDGIELAEAMWAAVQSLIDGILDAFEQAAPERLRT
jgi:hypothetical protein